MTAYFIFFYEPFFYQNINNSIINTYILVRILRFGEIMNFGLEKQLDRIVETLALSALMQANPSKKVEKKLKEIAFPLEIEL